MRVVEHLWTLFPPTLAAVNAQDEATRKLANQVALANKIAQWEIQTQRLVSRETPQAH